MSRFLCVPQVSHQVSQVSHTTTKERKPLKGGKNRGRKDLLLPDYQRAGIPGRVYLPERPLRLVRAGAEEVFRSGDCQGAGGARRAVAGRDKSRNRSFHSLETAGGRLGGRGLCHAENPRTPRQRPPLYKARDERAPVALCREPVSTPAPVGAGRSPQGNSTRGGSRDRHFQLWRVLL